MTDKVKELSEKLVEVIDDKEGKWSSAEEKLAHIRSYLLGLCDGYDYAIEKVEDTSAIYLNRTDGTLHTCKKCGQKTLFPVQTADGCYCENCIAEQNYSGLKK